VISPIPEANAIARAEHELLLCCVCPGQESVNRDRIRALVATDIDWNYLFLLARRHGVIPLLYSCLNKTAADVVPATELQRQQKYFQENSARNVLLTAELCGLIERLSRNGIEAIPYKGPMLALFAYNDLSLRRFVDLDIMVRKEDVARSIDFLLAEGYELSKPLNASQRQVLQRTQHNLQFRRHKGQLIVELHWEVASHLFASTVQAEDLWKNLTITELNGAAMKTLSPEDLIFSLLIHGSRHLWERLLWICDVGWIVSKHELNWQTLLERTRTTKTERMFLLGIYLSKKLLNVSLPSVIEKRIEQDRELEKLARLVIKGIFSGPENKPVSVYKMFEFNLKVRKAWSSRVRYFRQVLDPTDRDLSTVALPRALSFGYYLMRPVRLLFKTREGVR
jgi:Uncharacterised nucleotidyltransferase